MWRANKYSAQYPWVLRWSLEEKRANLCIARGHFGAIISMKIACQLAPGELEQKEGACRHRIDAAVHNTSSRYHDMIG